MPEKEEIKKQHNFFLNALMILCLLAIGASFYFYYFKKDYDFIVEAKCDPTAETCFYRDCTNPDDCPPNQLSYYNTYTIKAHDFRFCLEGDCDQVCKNGLISCQKTECTESDISYGICLIPNPNTLN